MQRESYQNTDIAAVLNKHFVAVKVDRELNPALDARLIDFVERTRGYSGWPLNVFVTPEGYPLLGLVYLPPADFRTLLIELQATWQNDAASLKRDAQLAAKELTPRPWPRGQRLPDNYAEQLRPGFNAKVMLRGDRFLGGFGEQSKFPNVPQLAALLESHARQPDAEVQKFLVNTLEHMAQLGLRDHLGGGFFRYTVDPQWRVPHFEKMLYDNALLARLYLRAGEVLNRPAFTAVAHETLRFMQSGLQVRGGAMAASLSAIDSNNVEGGYYLWQDDQLKAQLSADDYAFVREHWAMVSGPVTDDGYLAMAAVSLADMAAARGVPVKQLQQQRARIYASLRRLQEKRRVPRDDKRLAAWNALALTAFVEAARLGDSETWRQTAKQIRDYLVNTLWDGKQLYRARTEKGAPLGAVTLADYAYMAEALRHWSELSGEQADRQLAMTLVEQAWQQFFNDYGFRRKQHSLLALAEGEVLLADSPLPSASAVLIGETLRLFDKEHALHRQAREVLAAGSGLLTEEPFWFASHMQVLLMQP
jgi:hypothetical protein